VSSPTPWLHILAAADGDVLVGWWPLQYKYFIFTKVEALRSNQ
jgi:hypothetical protein